jgi:hypothetical protein
MATKRFRRMMSAAISVGAVAALAAGPMALAVQKPQLVQADTKIVNAGIQVNALNPSDNVHEVAKNVDPTNHQISSAHPNTTADFVLSLSGINNTGSNFTAPITAFYHSQGDGTTSSFTPTSGAYTFSSRYAAHYAIIKVPVQYNAALFAEKNGSFESFNFVISSVTNASIGKNPAIVYIVNGSGTGNVP